MRTFTYTDEKSHKFWNIELKGKSFTVTYGRQGTTGQTQIKDFTDEARARKEHDKLVTEKLAKGYTETTPAAAAAPKSLREALEVELVSHPDDLASHMAYADYLLEQGDPLGELIRIQLALEDQTKLPAERKKLLAQEQKLLGAQAPTWFGDLAPYLFPAKSAAAALFGDVRGPCTFSRGWLDTLEVEALTVAFARALARSPTTRLLRKLALFGNAWEEAGSYEPGPDLPPDVYDPQLFPLLRSPYLGNVRFFQLGNDDDHCHTNGAAAVALVKRMPRLEELHLFAHEVDVDELFALRTLQSLRVLRVYHLTNYPLAKLAKNPSLKNLTHLLIHPHALTPDDDEAYVRLPAVRALVRSPELPALTHLQLGLSDMGDKGMKEIVESGILKRLKSLELFSGCVSDVGARTLAACPDLRNLERLDLTRNCMTAAGIAALRATGIDVVAERQWQPGESGNWDESDRDYLYDGDIE
jgi:uncharacterized protein (TIGR02996 family)